MQSGLGFAAIVAIIEAWLLRGFAGYEVGLMSRRPGRSHSLGFTFKELVVAVLVLGILVAAAVPAYRTYSIRVNRLDAMRDLRGFSHLLDSCFARTGSYADSSCAVDVAGGLTNLEQTYATSAAVADDGYQLSATPINEQAGDFACGTFTLDQTGEQGVTGGTLTAQECWQGQAE